MSDHCSNSLTDYGFQANGLQLPHIAHIILCLCQVSICSLCLLHMPSGAGLVGPVSDPVMQVTLSNSGANMTAHSAICLHNAIFLHSTICMCNVQVWTCVVCRFGHVFHIYGHSHSMGTSVNVVIQEN